jgi:hypothetical protein
MPRLLVKLEFLRSTILSRADELNTRVAKILREYG